MFKNMRLCIFFDMFLNPSFKMATSSPIELELQLAQVNIYIILYENDVKLLKAASM